MVNSGERRCITIEILDDSDVESREQLSVRLTVESFFVRFQDCSIYITDNDGKSILLTMMVSVSSLIFLHNYTPDPSNNYTCPAIFVLEVIVTWN